MLLLIDDDKGDGPLRLEILACYDVDVDVAVVLSTAPVLLERLLPDDEDDDGGGDGGEEGGAEDAHGEVAQAAGAAVLGGAPGSAGVGGTLVFVDHGVCAGLCCAVLCECSSPDY